VERARAAKGLPFAVCFRPVTGQFQLSEYPCEYRRVYSALVLCSAQAYNGQVYQKICSAFYIWYKWRKRHKTKKENRLYDDNYLKYGFTVMANKPRFEKLLKNKQAQPSH
jgi:hypothetical protein